MNVPENNKQQEELFLSAVRQCQWDKIQEAVGQGVSTEQRDLAMSQAVRHCQWWLVSHLLLLGVSQQQRDLAAQKAARHKQWDCVQQLLTAGITSDTRDYVLEKAVSQSHWVMVSYLMTLGVKPKIRNDVVTMAVQDNKWDVVLDVVRLGVERQVEAHVVDKIIKKKKWEYVPNLMKLINQQEMMDCVVQAAIKDCQWGCVLELIKIGLTPDQQEIVCHEALEWSHFDCAFELLRQGISPQCAQRIVQEAVKWSQWHGLVQLLQEAEISINTRDTVLDSVKDNADVYVKLLEASRPTEKELSDVITAALHNFNDVLIYHMLALFKSSKRLIKQIFLVIKLSSGDAILLHTIMWNKEPDLAFYLFVCQQMWECIGSIYEDPHISTRARRFALRHAIINQAWMFVKQLACLRVTSSCDRRHAFLQAARSGEWHIALEISSQCVNIRYSDKVFALKMWLCLGLWECVSDVLEKWGFHSKIVKCILHEAIIIGQLECFKMVCSELYPGKVNEAFIFQTAVVHNQDDFVIEFCNSMGSANTVFVVFKLALKKQKWNLVNKLLEEEELYELMESKILKLCLRNIMQGRDAWPIVPTINSLCKNMFQNYDDFEDYDFDIILDDPECQHVDPQLLELCLDAPHVHLGLLLSILSNNEQTVERTMKTVHQKGFSSEDFIPVFFLAVRKRDWESAVVIMQYLSEEDAENNICSLDGTESDELIVKCREKGLLKWAVCVGTWNSCWDKVREDLKLYQDTHTIDMVIQEAAEVDEWDIVLSYLPQCSQDSSVLCNILWTAVRQGQSECSEMLIVKVNPLQARHYVQPLLCLAVNSAGDRESMVKLCIKAGLSTHLKLCDYDIRSPIRQALYNGQLPLVKLLYRAGACSNKQLFTHSSDQSLRARLSNQGRHDIVQYMDWMARTPRSLQDLCRLKISHCIGCQPSRTDRVSSLELPWLLRDFIDFADLVS